MTLTKIRECSDLSRDLLVGPSDLAIKLASKLAYRWRNGSVDRHDNDMQKDEQYFANARMRCNIRGGKPGNDLHDQ